MRRVNTILSAAALLFLAGCKSDYGVNPEGGESEGGDTTLACEAPALPGFTDTPDEECLGEFGVFDPVLEFYYREWSVQPDSKNVLMTPTVGSLNDDNGDGRIDETDTPCLLYTSPSPRDDR